MSAVGARLENRHPASVPRLLVELPSRPRVFLGNLRDLLLLRHPVPVELSSQPGEFWPDVFVIRCLPWNRFLQSVVYHVLAGAILIGVSEIFALQPRVVSQTPSFDHSQVVYYQAAQYLPPLDTRPPSSAKPERADPEFAPQPIISVPPESDNRSQTIVAPPKIKLKQEIAMPNIVAWSDAQPKPQLYIPATPVIPASEITRLAPTMESSVVTPAPDATRIQDSRRVPELQRSVVAPPPDLRNSDTHSAIEALQPALIAPPPSLQSTAVRRAGNINIGASNVIAPAPQLPVAPQRTIPGGTLAGASAAQIVPPPPSLSASGSAVASTGSRGRLIALNLHPAVTAPPSQPAGNRRGTFAAGPQGHRGASGAPGWSSGTSKPGSSAGTTRKTNNDLPAGLYVGKPAANPDAVAGNATNKATGSVDPNLVASARPPRVSSASPLQPESASKLTEAERAVFGNRKFYSARFNTPNLNSSGGSWVIRFAELNHDFDPRRSSSPAADLSQPMVTREVDPAYPTQLMRENVAGTVILYAVIRADGTVGNVRVLRGVDGRLDRFASEALAQWKFDPATKNGQPVDVEATFQIPFRPTRFASSF